MFTKKRNINLYRDALHSLLFEHPKGLSAIDIASQLKLSDSDCKKLLHDEEVFKQAVSSNIDTGTMLYTTERTLKPNLSFEDELKLVRKTKAKKKLIWLLGLLIIVIIILFPLFWSPIKTPVTQKSEPSQRETPEIPYRVQFTQEQQDLSKLITKMESEKPRCYSYWNKNELCYVTNRLLSKAEFESEIAEMKMRITEIKMELRQMTYLP